VSCSVQLKRIEPCLPRAAKQPPTGSGWIHEIKHDGYWIIAERDHVRVRLYTRDGYDFADRFPLAVAAVAKLPVKSCLIDGEAIVCDANGLAVFDLLRRRWHGEDVILCAFDLLELDGRDMPRAPIEERKSALAKLLRKSIDGIAFNEHYSGDGAIIYRHASALGCEGIVSKRLGSARLILICGETGTANSAHSVPRSDAEGDIPDNVPAPHNKVASVPDRRFPPPWSVDDPDMKLGQDCFIVRYANAATRSPTYVGRCDAVTSGPFRARGEVRAACLPAGTGSVSLPASRAAGPPCSLP
jgi:bifunctional non-homologous end joining protein LigD